MFVFLLVTFHLSVQLEESVGGMLGRPRSVTNKLGESCRNVLSVFTLISEVDPEFISLLLTHYEFQKVNICVCVN